MAAHKMVTLMLVITGMLAVASANANYNRAFTAKMVATTPAKPTIPKLKEYKFKLPGRRLLDMMMQIDDNKLYTSKLHIASAESSMIEQQVAAQTFGFWRSLLSLMYNRAFTPKNVATAPEKPKVPKLKDYKFKVPGSN